MIDSGPHSPRYYAIVIPTLAVLIAAVLGLTGYVYGQSQTTDRLDRTQHQVCQAFAFIGDRTQQQIDLTASRLKQDIAKGDRAASTLDRRAISDATSFLIRIKRVQC